MVFWGRGLAYTRESERDMEPVAAADRKRKEPKVARLACLTLAKKKIWKREKEELCLQRSRVFKSVCPILPKRAGKNAGKFGKTPKLGSNMLKFLSL